MNFMKPQSQETQKVPDEVVAAYQMIEQMSQQLDVANALQEVTPQEQGTLLGEMALELFKAVQAQLAKKNLSIPAGDMSKALIERAVKLLAEQSPAGQEKNMEAMFGLYTEGLQVALGKNYAQDVKDGNMSEDELQAMANGGSDGSQQFTA